MTIRNQFIKFIKCLISQYIAPNGAFNISNIGYFYQDAAPKGANIDRLFRGIILVDNEITKIQKFRRNDILRFINHSQ
jgi:hypothetical protein